MNYFGIAIFIVLNLYWSDGKLNQYCSICKDHTMCQFQGSAFGEACADAGEGGINEDDISLIVETHNFYRKLVAGGHEKRGKNGAPQPKAANLMKLTWDDELATIAQKWADQCLFQHDTCRHVSKYRVGQNLYWSWRFPITNAYNWSVAIQSWYDEVEKFDPEKVKAYEFDPETGHFTQMLWHNTKTVGCGRRNYGPNKIYVCNYGPAGNWIDEPMYLVGEPCSKCPSGTYCNEQLCDAEPGKSLESNVIKAPSKPLKTTPKKEEPPQEPIFDYLIPPKKEAENVFDNTKAFKLEPKITLTKTNKEILPTENRFSLFEGLETSTGFKPEEGTTEPRTTTELPIDFNVIDDLELTENDDDIKKEIEDLKIRIRDLVQKIITRKRSNQ